MNDINLGGRQRPKDPRDILLDSVQSPVSIPDEYLPDISWVVRNYQGQTPTCGAHASSHFNAILQQFDGTLNKHFSPRYSWIKIKQIDGYPLEDGTDMVSIFQSLQKDGSCDYSLAGNSVDLPLVDYSSSSFITPEMDSDAQPNIIKAYAFTDLPTFEQIRQAIYRNKITLLMLRVDEGFWGTTTPTFSTGQWGHFVVATGYTQTSIRILDSADPDNTMATKFIDKQYITGKYTREMGTAIDIPNWQVNAMTSEIALLKTVVSLIIKLLNIKK